jgi:hypothetical protein
MKNKPNLGVKKMGEKSLKFSIKNANGEEISFEGNNLDNKQVDMIYNDIILPKFKNGEEDKVIEESVNEEIKDKNDENKSLNLQSNTSRTSTSIGEIVGDKLQLLYSKHPPTKIDEEDKDGKPDFYHTGIKYKGKNQIPHYRTYYNCPRCNKDGRHYIPSSGVEFVVCHNCQSKLQVEPATDYGFGLSEKYRDGWGNYFVANKLYIDNEKMYHKLIDKEK